MIRVFTNNFVVDIPEAMIYHYDGTRFILVLEVHNETKGYLIIL